MGAGRGRARRQAGGQQALRAACSQPAHQLEPRPRPTRAPVLGWPLPAPRSTRLLVDRLLGLGHHAPQDAAHPAQQATSRTQRPSHVHRLLGLVHHPQPAAGSRNVLHRRQEGVGVGGVAAGGWGGCGAVWVMVWGEGGRRCWQQGSEERRSLRANCEARPARRRRAPGRPRPCLHVRSRQPGALTAARRRPARPERRARRRRRSRGTWTARTARTCGQGGRPAGDEAGGRVGAAGRRAQRQGRRRAQALHTCAPPGSSTHPVPSPPPPHLVARLQLPSWSGVMPRAA